jgi:hypothetical protein
MLSSYQMPKNVVVSKTATSQSVFAKVLGLAIHIGILYFGTILAEYGWRMWSIC